MVFSGQQAIDFLASQIDKVDAGASSHWRKYHANFKFNGEMFDGLDGFGGNKKRNLIGNTIHRILQRRFRRQGENFPSFAKIDCLANQMTLKQSRMYDLDVLRQAITVSFLKETLADELSSEATVCVIGDGFASMTSLLLASRTAQRVILVNLTKTLCVDLWYLKLFLGEETFESSVDLVQNESGLYKALEKPVSDGNGVNRVIAIQAEHHKLISKCPIDLVINIASMQEMDPPVTNRYFEDMREIAGKRKLHFYCCNREEKTLPDGTVARFRDYPWEETDKFIVDELCPWHQEYYNRRFPIYRFYDGPSLHRLTRVSQNN